MLLTVERGGLECNLFLAVSVPECLRLSLFIVVPFWFLWYLLLRLTLQTFDNPSNKFNQHKEGN